MVNTLSLLVGSLGTHGHLSTLIWLSPILRSLLYIKPISKPAQNGLCISTLDIGFTNAWNPAHMFLRQVRHRGFRRLYCRCLVESGSESRPNWSWSPKVSIWDEEYFCVSAWKGWDGWIFPNWHFFAIYVELVMSHPIPLPFQWM